MRRVRRLPATLLVLVALASVGASASAASARTTLRVFAAASLSGAFTDLAHALEHRHPGLSVQLSFAGSQQLASQIEQGAAADVFASADDRWMRYVQAHRWLAGEASTFVRNRLVVVVPKSNPARIRRLQDLARGGVKLVIGADAVPVGRYTRAMLANLARDPAFGADFATRTLANVVSEEENVEAIAGKVQLGEADAGVVYRSDVTPVVARDARVIEIPERANILASYPIATLAHATHADEAKAFVDLVLSPEGQRILARRGFIPVSAPPP